MGLKVEEDETSLVVRAPDGCVRFRRGEFTVVEDENDYKVVQGPFEEDIFLQEEAQNLKIEFYGAESYYVIQMVSKFITDWAPDLKQQFVNCYGRKRVPFEEVCSNGSGGFLYEKAGGSYDLLVPDHAFFASDDAEQAKVATPKGFHKVPGQVVQEVESATDHRTPGRRKASTHEKCFRYLESPQVELVIAWYPRTKEVQLHWKDANGNPVSYPVYFNPEWVPLDQWPGGHFRGLRLYLSYLRKRRALWGSFSKESYNPDGSKPRWLGRDQNPVDPPQVARRQTLYNTKVQPRPVSERIDVLVDVVRDGDLEDVQLTVAHCDSMKRMSIDGRLPLVEAVIVNDLEKVKELLTQGADPADEDMFGRSALGMAALFGAPWDGVRNHLASLGAPLPAVTLSVAVDCLRGLLTTKSAPAAVIEEFTGLVEDARPGALWSLVEDLVDAKAKDMSPYLRLLLGTSTGAAQIAALGGERESLVEAIMSAAIKGAVDTLKVFKEFGILDVRNEEGLTALMIVIQLPQLKPMRALCLAGANLEAEDDRHLTALGMALESGKKQIADELARHGAEMRQTYRDAGYEVEP